MKDHGQQAQVALAQVSPTLAISCEAVPASEMVRRGHEPAPPFSPGAGESFVCCIASFGGSGPSAPPFVRSTSGFAASALLTPVAMVTHSRGLHGHSDPRSLPVREAPRGYLSCKGAQGAQGPDSRGGPVDRARVAKPCSCTLEQGLAERVRSTGQLPEECTAQPRRQVRLAQLFFRADRT